MHILAPVGLVHICVPEATVFTSDRIVIDDAI